MKIESKQLGNLLKKIKPAMLPNPPNAILNNFLIGEQQIVGTSLSITIIEKVDTSSTSFTLPFNEVVNICNIVDGELEVSPELIQCGRDKFKLGEPIDVAAYPKTLHLQEGPFIYITENFVQSLLNATMFVYNEKTAVQGNVFVQVSGNTATIYATDMHTLYKESFNVEAEEFSALIPVDVIRCLSVSDYKMMKSEGKIVFSNETSKIIGLTAEGRFPSADHLFTNLSGESLAINREVFEKALMKVKVYNIIPVCRIKFNKTNIEFIITDNNLNRQAVTYCDIENSISIESIAINADLMLRLLSVYKESEVVNLLILTERSPVFVSAENSNVRCLIMPNFLDN